MQSRSRFAKRSSISAASRSLAPAFVVATVLGDAVAPPLLHDESRSERSRKRDPDYEPDPGERRVIEGEADRPRSCAEDSRDDESRREG